MPGAVAKTKKATNILRPAIDVTFDKDAEFEVFPDSRRFFHGFFLEKVALYGEVAIKSRSLEAKALKFSPPKSLCGTVGSPWVSLATLFGFWETFYMVKKVFLLFFLFSEIRVMDKKSS